MSRRCAMVPALRFAPRARGRIPGLSRPPCEVQLLRYRQPDPIPDPGITRLNRIGFNHVCFAVDDLGAEVARLTASGVKLRNDVMDFHDRKLVFLAGPEGVTVELAQWR